VPGPRYAPRDFTSEPAAFGRAARLTWPPPLTRKDAVRRRAAQLQHRYALRIRARLVAKRLNVSGYAKEAGTNYDRLARVLRGEVVMRLEDIALADLVLGEVSEDAQERARQQQGPTSPHANPEANSESPTTALLEAQAAALARREEQRRKRPAR
jgi:hypothetical protein